METAATGGGGGRSDDIVAFSLPSSPLYGTASVSHPPQHAFMPITPAPQGAAQSAAVSIVAPTPVVPLLPFSSESSPLVILPPQRPPAAAAPLSSAADSAPAYFSPVMMMSPGILNTAFAPANPLLFASGLPAPADLPPASGTGAASSPEDVV
jgi:hypothetical protein